MTQPDPRRRIPRTDTVLAALDDLVVRLGAERVKGAVLDAQSRARSGQIAPEDVESAARAALAERPVTTLRSLVNATGVVLHTNIGRAALSQDAVAALTVAAGPVDVEFDTETGVRARRGRGALAALAAAVPSAGGALAVNNGAAALVLATTALAVAQGRPDIVMSRGEIVEIGDNFRLHELIESTGAAVVEVGTTNRTWAHDYSAAITERTGLVLKVHPSNFVVEGFTHGVEVTELAELLAEVRRERGLDVPLVVDIGSGLLRPDSLLPDEPDATSNLTAGADLVTSSGDKLLGGPQAGIVVGRADLVERMRRFPLARAVRVDKLTLAALEATLVGGVTPTHAALHADLSTLRRRSDGLAERLQQNGIKAVVVPSDGAVGGGGAPGVVLPGAAVAVDESLAAPLRRAGVVTRTRGGRCLLDLRAVPVADEERLIEAVLAAVRAGAGDGAASDDGSRQRGRPVGAPTDGAGQKDTDA